MDQNIPKREEKELRKERAQLRSNLKKLFMAIIGVGLLAGIIYVSTRPQAPRPGEEITVLESPHIEDGAEHPPYNSNPPTSGPHYARPAEWGVYQEALPDEQLVHNLEHGGIWISYNGIDENTKTQLEALAKRYPRSVVIAPRDGGDSPIALASWGRLEKLETFDEERVRNFIRRNINKSPEPLAL